jgi:4-hydroxy-tetrahydrodipicolinate synthase
MQRSSTPLAGIWLPLITPFLDGAVDEAALARLVQHYLAQPIDGFILAATTGEGLVLDEGETERVGAIAAESLAGKRRLVLGLCGSDTLRLARRLAATRSWPVDGYLVACPYYSRPSQEGLYLHFARLAEETERPILVYNIPYRTGVNLANDTLLRLAELPAIAGVKDCSADPTQSFDLIRRRRPGFAVLTGEDAQFYGWLAHGADGGVLASAHVDAAGFARLRGLIAAGQAAESLACWEAMVDLVRLMFAEPSPAAIKHWLWRLGLIHSPELRLPMVSVSPGLAGRLDRLLQGRRAA